MAQKITNYKCPACTGPLNFDADSGRLKCDYCGSEYETSYIEKLMAQADEKAAAGEDATGTQSGQDGAEGDVNVEATSKVVGEWDGGNLSEDWGKEGKNVNIYNCPSCGAELICDETTAATSCPYCGNNTIVPGKLSGVYKPDYIIPFKCGKDQAKENLLKYYKGKYFLPKSFSETSHIEEIKGIYVPFWLFDGTADAEIMAEGTNTSVMRQGEYTVTSVAHYDVSRRGTVQFNKIPVDASSRMPDDYMDSLEPFNYDDLKDFSASYLPGYVADKYDVEFKDCQDRVNKRCASTAVSSLESTISGYMNINVISADVKINEGKVSYGLLPVWLLNSTWDNKNFKFAVNGQTGKVVGELPTDKKRVAGAFSLLTLISAILIFFVSLWCNGAVYGHVASDYFTSTFGLALLTGLIPAALITFSLSRGMKNVSAGLVAGRYVPNDGLKLSLHQDNYTHTTRSMVRNAVRSNNIGGVSPGGRGAFSQGRNMMGTGGMNNRMGGRPGGSFGSMGGRPGGMNNRMGGRPGGRGGR